MNDLLDLMLRRRSVRTYTDEPVTREQIEAVLQAGLLAPTGRNRRPWEFVVVRDRATLEALAASRAGGGAKMLSTAAAAIVVFGDTETSDTCCEDCSIALSYMQLMAASLGLGSCWVQGRMRETPEGLTTDAFCRDLLGVPEGYMLEATLSLGIPAQEPVPHTLDDADMGKVHWETF